jgi:cephalosporin hydroxylase
MGCDYRWKAFLNEIGGEILQNRVEVEVVYYLVEAIRPCVFVEIGSAHGGTLVIYAGACAPGATIVTIDWGLNHSYAEQLGHSVELVNARGYYAHWIRGDSHAPSTAAELARLLDGVAIDFLHVDGDHREASCLADWRMYGPLVRPGGLVAFHDIAFEPEPGARAAWDQIKPTQEKWTEIIGMPVRVSGGGAALYRLGVGVLWKT